jgi:hypothetical protein
MFIRVLVLIGSRRKVVGLFTHFYPSILHRGCARARGRARGETLYPPSPWPWFALLSANGPATEEATLGWCGVVWRPVRVIGPPVSLSAGTRGTSEPENGRVRSAQGTGGEARGRSGAAVSRVVQKQPSTVPPPPRLPSPPLASSSPHKYPLSHVPQIPSSATSATHDWQPSTRTHTRTQPLQIDPPVLPTLISTPTPSRPLAQASV